MDLGALVLTLPDGVEVRLDVDEASQTVGAVGVVLEPLMLQVMAYAAPRTAGIWTKFVTRLPPTRPRRAARCTPPRGDSALNCWLSCRQRVAAALKRASSESTARAGSFAG